MELPVKILILGVNGFVGSHLTDRILQDTTWEIYGMDLASNKVAEHRGNPPHPFVEGTISHMQ